jgi:hypothetical protein
VVVRVAPRELQAVDRAGMLTRFSVLGPVAYVQVTFPADGTVGTGLDEPCVVEHHGLVTRGALTVDHEDGRTETFDVGTAFYVPAGPPSHVFRVEPHSIIGGFAPLEAPVDTSAEGLAALGFTPVEPSGPPAAPPRAVHLAGAVEPFRRRGAIDVEGSRMGDWVFMRSIFGPRSGYTSGWCDLPHWGVVLDGEIAIGYDDHTELAARGDVFYSPPGHRFVSADGATIVDYTPLRDLRADRISAWRRAVATAGNLAPPPEPVSERTRAQRLRRASGPSRRLRWMPAPA